MSSKARRQPPVARYSALRCRDASQQVEHQFAQAIPHDLNAQAEKDEGRQAKENDGACITQTTQKIVGIAKGQIEEEADGQQSQRAAAHPHQ